MFTFKAENEVYQPVCCSSVKALKFRFLNNYCALISTVHNIMSRIFKSFDVNILVRYFVSGHIDIDQLFLLS